MNAAIQKIKSMDEVKHPISLVVLRESNFRPVFQNEIQKQHFLYLLSSIQKQERNRLYAYCILDGEVYLLMESEKTGTQTPFIKILKSAFEQKCRENGFCEQLSLTDELCGTYSWSMLELMEGCVSLHKLPVYRKIAEQAGDYWWSSYREYCQQKGCHVLNPDRLLESLSDNHKYAVRLFASLHNKTYENEICDQIRQKSGMM